MVSALICGEPSLPAWRPIPSRAQKQSVERRWRRFLGNERIRVEALYVPLVVAALRWLAPAPPLSGFRHHGAVEPLIPPVGGLLWASSAVVMASVRAVVQRWRSGVQ